MSDDRPSRTSVAKRKVIPRTSSVVSRQAGVVGKYSRPTNIKNRLGQAFDERSQVSFTKRDRLHHTHILGSTGTGKSKFMELLMRSDMQDRRCGFCLIDPHGSLYDEVLLYASHRHSYLADRFILFNPAGERDQIVGFNPIPANAIETLDYVLEMMIAGCLKAWGQDNTDRTPRISKWLENLFLTVIANDLTLVETAPLLSVSSKYNDQRNRLLANVRNELVLDDWEMFEASTNTQKQALIEGAANRLRKFLRNEAIRMMIGQQERVLDLQSIMDEGMILLVNLAGGDRISFENTKLVGIMLVNEFFRAAKLRDPRDPNLKPFFLYIDEFANFITRDIARALEECRKFGLYLTLAHQHLAQLRSEDEYLYASVLTNCQNKVVFGGLSREDAEIMAQEVSTGFHDLKRIKDEVFNTRVRHIEETRVVRGKTRGSTSSESESQTEITTETRGSSEAHGRSESETITDSETFGTSESESRSRGTTLTRGSSRGVTDSRGTMQSATRGSSDGTTHGTSESHGSSDTHGTSYSEHQGESGSETWGSSDSTGSSRGTNSGTNTSSSRGSSDGSSFNSVGSSHGTSHGENRGDSQGRSHSESSGTSESHSTSRGGSSGWSRGTTQGRSESHSTSQSRGVHDSTSHSDSHSESRGQSQSHADHESTTESQGETETHGHTKTRSRSESHSVGHTTGTTETVTESRSRSEGESQTRGTSSSESQGESESTVPFLKPVEYQELTSRTFWSVQELEYMEMAEMKNQGTGVAFIKIGGGRPIQTTIEHVKAVPFNPRFSPKRIDTFRGKVFEAHPECYLPADEALETHRLRQIEVFGEPLRFDEAPVPALAVEADDYLDEELDPFTDV